MGWRAGTNKPGKTRKAQPEQAFQAQLVRDLRMVLEPDCFLFAVPNGGHRSMIEAAILVGQGVVPGVPDLMVLHGGTAAGMELKASAGVVSQKQRDVHRRFRAAGIPVAVIRSLDEALDFLRANNVPLRIAARGAR